MKPPPVHLYIMLSGISDLKELIEWLQVWFCAAGLIVSKVSSNKYLKLLP